LRQPNFFFEEHPEALYYQYLTFFQGSIWEIRVMQPLLDFVYGHRVLPTNQAKTYSASSNPDFCHFLRLSMGRK